VTRNILLLLTLLGASFPVLADEPDDAQVLLQKIQVASKKVSYSGIFVFQHENQLNSSRIFHSFDGSVELEKIEKLDGRRLEFVRHNEDITRYQPDTKTLRVEKRQDQDMFPAVLAFNSPSLSDHYQFRLADVSRVAGVECRIVEIEPRDNLRYGYRLCAAIPSNLMLMAQTTGPDNQVLEQIAFTNLTLAAVDPNNLKASFTDVSDWKTTKGAVVASTESGWKVKSLPPGFKKMREVRRLINTHSSSAVGAAGQTSDLHEVLQMVFSDGLASISVFVEPLNLEHHTGVVQQGATTISGFQQGAYWVTLVGEVPPAAIKLLADSIEYKVK
jgi:sigma-E factor negative regulatory protein RseB